MLKAYALKFRPEGMKLPFHWWRLKGIAVHSTSNAATERDLSSHDFELGGESDDIRYPRLRTASLRNESPKCKISHESSSTGLFSSIAVEGQISNSEWTDCTFL